MKNLIRNGGFERGTIDFWTSYDAKSFAADAAAPFKGAYAGKLVCDGVNNPYAITNDYIPLAVGEIAYFEASLRANGMYSAYLRVEYYDEALGVMETVDYGSFNPGVGAWKRILKAISGIEGAIYCRPYLYLARSTLDDYMLIDNVSMYKYIPEDVMGMVRLMEKQTGLSAAATITSDYIPVGAFREAVFFLYVGTLTGTTPTLDVVIESKSAFDSNEHEIAAFEQVVASDVEQVIVLTEGIDVFVRVNATLAGTSLACAYWLEGKFKR